VLSSASDRPQHVLTPRVLESKSLSALRVESWKESCGHTSATALACRSLEVRRSTQCKWKHLDNKRSSSWGSSGLGFAVAELAASFGADVDRVQQRRTSSNSNQIYRGKSDGRTLDVSNERAIHTFFTELGAFDHLVFTAAIACTYRTRTICPLRYARHLSEMQLVGSSTFS